MVVGVGVWVEGRITARHLYSVSIINMLLGQRCTESIEPNVTGVQINELMKLPGITSNLHGLMQCLVSIL